jgi:hypothetical protein
MITSTGLRGSLVEDGVFVEAFVELGFELAFMRRPRSGSFGRLQRAGSGPWPAIAKLNGPPN